jgi:hypothetical protein
MSHRVEDECVRMKCKDRNGKDKVVPKQAVEALSVARG